MDRYRSQVNKLNILSKRFSNGFFLPISQLYIIHSDTPNRSAKSFFFNHLSGLFCLSHPPNVSVLIKIYLETQNLISTN